MGRRLGQHFLIRPSLLERIASAVCPVSAGVVVEIGPGRGALTDHLLTRAAQVIAIEVDPVLVQYLRVKYRDERRVQVIESDILKLNLAGWGQVTIAGNLPYYITSPIIEKTLALGPLLTHAVFLVQKEVAQRITTGPGSRDYGYLSVATQFYAVAELLFSIAPGAFRPPPKVDSAVVRLTPRADIEQVDPRRFLAFAGLCFHHKRKTLRNNLAEVYSREALDSLGDLGKRAEQLSIENLLELYRKLAA